MARRIEGGPSIDFIEFHAGDAILPVFRVLTAEGCGRVDEDVGVMDDLRISGPDFHGADVARLFQGVGKHKFQEGIGTGRGQCVGALDGEDEVGCAVVPCAVVFGSGRRHGEITGWHRCLHPSSDDVDILLAETTFVTEVAVPGLGQPRRHVPGMGYGSYLRAAANGVLIGEKAEWTCATRMMAGCAVFIEDWSDVAGPCDDRGCARLRSLRCMSEHCEQSDDPECKQVDRGSPLREPVGDLHG